MSGEVIKVQPEHILINDPIDISWEAFVERLSNVDVYIADMPGEIYNDPVFRGIVILDGLFKFSVLTKDEARYLLVNLTDIPDKRIIDLVTIVDKYPQ